MLPLYSARDYQYRKQRPPILSRCQSLFLLCNKAVAAVYAVWISLLQRLHWGIPTYSKEEQP